jgi:hypothetical protein
VTSSVKTGVSMKVSFMLKVYAIDVYTSMAYMASNSQLMSGMERAYGPRVARVCRPAKPALDEPPSVVRIHLVAQVKKKATPMGWPFL